MENDNQGNDYALKFLADMEAKYAALGNAIAGVRAALSTGALKYSDTALSNLLNTHFYQVEIRRRPARGLASITIQQYHKLLLPQETNLVNGVYSDP